MIFGKKLAGIFTILTCAAFAYSGVSADNDLCMQTGVTIGGVNVSGMNYSQALAAVQEKVTQLQSDKVNVLVGDYTITTTAADLGLQWKNHEVIEEALALGNTGNIVTRYKNTKDAQSSGHAYDIELSANEKLIRYFISQECMEYEKDPAEATIAADGTGGIDVTAGEDGLKINVDESVQKIADYLENNLEDDGRVELSVTVEPIASKEDLESITDCLGTYTTYYGSTYDRNVNVERGAELLNGHLIKPGEKFSVCEHLVPFNAENGYELAGAYENGRVVQEYGGGICQVSTTLYNALLLAEIQIDERHNHTMSVSYVPTSMDAAIAEGSMDLVFTNNLDTPIFLSGYAAGGELTFSIWGKETRPADRYVTYYSEETGTIPDSGITQLYPAEDQAAGYFAQVQYAQAGSTAVLYKSVTYNGETTVEQVNYSEYDPTPNAYEVGTIGATDTLLNAIYNNDVATAQLAATGTVTQQQTTTTYTDPTAAYNYNTYTTPATGYGYDTSTYYDATAGYY